MTLPLAGWLGGEEELPDDSLVRCMDESAISYNPDAIDSDPASCNMSDVENASQSAGPQQEWMASVCGTQQESHGHFVMA